MLSLDKSTRVFLSLVATDMRRGCNSLSAVVEEHFARNSLDGALYVFVSRDRKKVKLLQWDRDGYWLHYKRLETSTFRIKLKDDGSKELTGVDLVQLLSGIDLRRIQLSKKVNQSLSVQSVA